MESNINATICLNQSYSTTRCLTKQKPEIINRPGEKIESRLFMPPSRNRKAEGGLRTEAYFKETHPEKPLITIITVVYNGEEQLEETILSVLNQSYDNIEYVIIDGNSSDKTLQIIKKYENAVDYYISEPDKGLYFAMNKGLCLAQGEIIGILNCGDNFLHEATKKCRDFFVDSQHCSILAGGMIKIDRKSSFAYKVYSNCLNRRLPYSELRIFHPATFVKKDTFKEVGFFNTKYKIIADTDFFIRACNLGFCFKFCKIIFTEMQIGGVSEKLSSCLKMSVEHFKLRNQYDCLLVKNFFITIDYFIKKTVYCVLSSFFGPKRMRSFFEFYKNLKSILFNCE